MFSGRAGGDSRRQLAASPLLMLTQMAALPLLLWLFDGPDIADIGPFLEAFGILIVIPLALAWVTQTLAARHRSGIAITAGFAAAIVPLMAATLLVIAGQMPKAPR